MIEADNPDAYSDTLNEWPKEATEDLRAFFAFAKQ